MNGIDIESCSKASHIFQNVGNDESKFLEYFIIKYDPYTTFYHDYNRNNIANAPSSINQQAQPTANVPLGQQPTIENQHHHHGHNHHYGDTNTGTPGSAVSGYGSPLPTSPMPVPGYNNNSSSSIINTGSVPPQIHQQPNSPGGSNDKLIPNTPSYSSFSTLTSMLNTSQPTTTNSVQPTTGISPSTPMTGTLPVIPTIVPPEQSETFSQKEEREYYKRPRCNWRNAVKYREQIQSSYRFGQVHLMKIYTQPDLKILTLSSSSLKESIKTKGWIDIDNKNVDQKTDMMSPRQSSDSRLSILNSTVKTKLELSQALSEIPDEEKLKKEKEKLDKERERLVDEFTGIMNYSSTNTEDWKSNGFHLMDVRLLDGRVILNTRKNFRHTTKPFKHHFSYDLLTYSLFGARDSHMANRLTGKRKKILNKMFQDDLPVSTMKDLHDNLLSETDDFLYEQWVSKVVNCSSEYISRSRSEGGAAPTTADDDLCNAHSRADYPPFSVSNLLGVINTYPKYGSFGTAWSPSNRTFGFGSLEFLEFEVEDEMFITEVRIFETFCPGGVFKIALWNKNVNSWETVYLGKPYDSNCRLMERSRVFAPTLAVTNYKTKRVRIDFDLRKSPSGWTEIDGILIRGFVDSSDRLRVLARQQLQTKKDTISLNKEVLHFPYSYLSHSPFDYQFGVLCFVYTESSYYHINSTLVVIGGTELLKDEVFLEVTYSKDYIAAVKLLSNKTCMAVVKLARVPVQYCVHIYDITLKRLTKTFELKELPTDAKEVKVWELTQQVIACSVDKTIYVYDISNSTSMTTWRLLHVLDDHQSTVTSLSLNTELIDLSNILVSASADKTVKVWSLHTGNCLMTLEHPGPMSSAKLIAAGSMVATVCINEPIIRIWSICGKDAGELVRVLRLPSLTAGDSGFTQKEIFFDESYFTYFEKGTNEYVLGRFHTSDDEHEHATPTSEQQGDEASPTPRQDTWVGSGKDVILNKYNIVNKYQGNAEACTIL